MMSIPSTRRLTVATCAAAAASILVLSGCSPDGGDGEGESTATKQVEHARGTADVPEDPQRVVVLEPVELDSSIALGVTPVGAAVVDNAAGLPSYLGADKVETVGTVSEPDLEAIASLNPDLILGTEARHSKLYDQLGSIAPTVFMASQDDPWQENVGLVGEALNKSEEAQSLLDGFNERCEQIKADNDVDGKTANLVRPRDETTLALYGPTSFSGSALECTGMSIPEREWADGFSTPISPENIRQAKADYVFVTSADTGDESTIPSAITENSGDFPSVTLVDTSYWISGVGPRGGELVLDDIEKFLQEQK